MRVSCVLSAAELDPVQPAQLIVFPEGIHSDEIGQAASTNPTSTIVAATRDGDNMRGVVWHKGRNRIDYLKIGSDNRTIGTGKLPESPPVFETDQLCVGVIVCMDIQRPDLLLSTTDRVQKSRSATKALCVPADMDYSWFSGRGQLLNPDGRFSGMHVVLVNNVLTYSGVCRTKSFITNLDGTVAVLQREHEPVHYRLTPSVVRQSS